MKVISGYLKGRNIIGYNILGTRPTMDRVKESVFATIQNKVNDSTVLDLFSGSGNYGIEAISMGAKEVYFNDYNKECIKIIKKNLENFNILNQAVILNLDYLKCLKKLEQENKKFDIIFLDPPYKTNFLKNAILFIDNSNLLTDNGIVVCEFLDDYVLDFKILSLLKKKKYGDKKVYIYEVNHETK